MRAYERVLNAYERVLNACEREDTQMKKKSEPMGGYIVFALAGLLFLIVGIVLIINTSRILDDAVEVTGVIREITTYTESDGDVGHKVYVDYEYEGEAYYNKFLSLYTATMSPGKSIDLLIDPDAPDQPYTVGNIVVGVICTALGALLICVGISPFVKRAHRKAKAKRLIKQGHYLPATIDSVKMNFSHAVNGLHPYIVYCSYEDRYTGTLYKFKSEEIWYNPRDYHQKGMDIKVYVKGQDYSKYHVDLEGSIAQKIVDYT